MKYLSLLLFAAISHVAVAQNLIESRQTSYYTYIFELNDKEARKIYKKSLWRVDDSFLHTQVDSFPTDSSYSKMLPEGHYLKVHTEKNRLRFDITSVQNFDVMIAGNNSDLVVRVYDPAGNIVPDADVKVRWKHLRFDKKTNSYVDRKSNQKGFLKVSWQGFTAYYDLSRQYNNSALRRTTRKVVYGSPVKYVWKPVRYAIFLPIDGVKSLVYGYPQGTVQRTTRFFVNSFNQIACLFDDFYCDYNSSSSFQDKHKGYLVFSKPKYMPGDTVKFKAFIVNKKGKPVNDPVHVILQRPGKNLRLATLTPYRDGGFSHQFYLHDSLELQLDRNYRIWLEKRDDKEYISGSFYYEDYELSSVSLDLAVESEDHFRGDEQVIRVSGTDENELRILDGRLEVLVRRVAVNKYFGPYVFVPDTLEFQTLELEKEDDTEISIPDSVFPAANLTYEVVVTLLTSDNEKITQGQELNYYHHKSEIIHRLENDSISFSYHLNGKEKKLPVRLFTVDNFGNRKMLTKGMLPLTTAINPYHSAYYVETDSINKLVGIKSESSLVQCFSERTRDSIRVVVQNPRNLPFSYYIYRRNRQKERGYADSLSREIRATAKENYFVSLHYLWGGRMVDETFRIPYYDKSLTIKVVEPKIVYPSQEATIELLVTDAGGNPVPGVDLTAYSITRKFDYSPPVLPYLGDQGKNRSVINHFGLGQSGPGIHSGLKLDHQSWRLLAGLDTIAYYDFIYPGNGIYRYRYESEITQFAPFFISEGSIDPVHVVYVDSKPVYFSWSTNTRPYSFPVDTGYHQVKLRTSQRTVVFDSLRFQEGTKTILSVSDSIAHRNVSIREEKSSLTSNEKRTLYKYIMPYRYGFGDRYAYIEQGGQAQFLKPDGAGGNRHMAGPVSPSYTKFQLVDGFSLEFVHEPQYEYEFKPGLLKMRSVDPEDDYPDFLFSHSARESLTDEVITKQDIENGWKEYLARRRYLSARYQYPRSTSKGNGTMQILVESDPGKVEKSALNILLFRYDDHQFLRVYPGNMGRYHDLGEGYYKLLLFYPGSEYAITDSLYVAANGLNHHQIPMPETTKKDSFSIQVSRIIEEAIFSGAPTNVAEEVEMRQIYNAYRQEFRYTGAGDVVEGYVYGEEGEPIPGATVVVQGTTFGTVTDFEGYYSLKVPADRNTLLFSFIGYETEEVMIGYQDVVNVTMKPDVCALEEVVVTAMGVSRESAVLYCMAETVSTTSISGIPGAEAGLTSTLSGKVAGVQITRAGASGDMVAITIRGAGTTKFEKEPLYIIDGVVYAGDIGEVDPNLIRNIQILKGEEGTALYGSRAIHGVVLITTGGDFKPASPLASMGAGYDEAFLEAASQASSIRNNFSDQAFWQPTLITDEDGAASFKVTFPDDVTSWRTFYLAMNGHKQTGQAEGVIKSYKPLMAQLAVPRFLMEGDTTYAIGKVLNYTTDSVSVHTKFELNGQLIADTAQTCIRSLLDTLELTTTSTDSLTVKYYLEKADGYFDGEQREIPVFPVGLEETAGQFHVLQGDTSIMLNLSGIAGAGNRGKIKDENMEVTLYARADVLEVMGVEISRLINYKYSCNEQLASKLKALLAEQQIADYKNERFKRERQVEKVIRLLIRNQIENGLWGWWKSSGEASLWISTHVLEALVQAREMDYRVNLDVGNIAEMLTWELEKPIHADRQLRILKILNMMEAQVSYPAYLERIRGTGTLNMNQLFRLMELEQMRGLETDTDTLFEYRKETMFGNLYFSDDSVSRWFYTNEIQNTLTAYRILRTDSTEDHSGELQRIRNYIFEQRSRGGWLNTFESAKILETILPDMLVGGKELVKPVITFSGALDQTVEEFPFEAKVSPGDTIEVEKRGDFPVYLTTYVRYWNPAPLDKRSDFEISTHFSGIEDNRLKGGEPAEMIVHVKVLKDADYVMVNVPIPAGCSYGDKSARSRHEVHREYFRNETAIFCENLEAGNYRFTINLIPRYSGSYTVNPARVEMMYFPTFNANNGIRHISVR